MARVKVLGTIEVGGRRIKVKKVRGFMALLKDSTLSATATQLRVVSEESRELLLDKLYAGAPARGTQARVDRPPLLRQPGGVMRERRPFRHKALAKRTIARKRRLMFDGRKLIEGGDYTYGIEVFKGRRSGGVGVYYMVRPAGRRHRGTNPRSGPITLKMLARVHEFGSAKHGIPARPHWGPTFRLVKLRVRNLARDIPAQALRDALRGVA